MELVRQPIYLLLLSFSAAFGVFLSAVPYFGFGDDPKLVKDSVLAVMLLAGLFGAVLSASASVAREIRSGTEKMGTVTVLESREARFYETRVRMRYTRISPRCARISSGEMGSRKRTRPSCS